MQNKQHFNINWTFIHISVFCGIIIYVFRRKNQKKKPWFIGIIKQKNRYESKEFMKYVYNVVIIEDIIEFKLTSNIVDFEKAFISSITDIFLLYLSKDAFPFFQIELQLFINELKVSTDNLLKDLSSSSYSYKQDENIIEVIINVYIKLNK